MGQADGRPSLFYPLVSLKHLGVGSPNSWTHQKTLQGFTYVHVGVWTQWASTSSSNQSTNVFTSLGFFVFFSYSISIVFWVLKAAQNSYSRIRAAGVLLTVTGEMP